MNRVPWVVWLCGALIVSSNVPVHGQWVYWTQEATISRASLDGTNQQLVLERTVDIPEIAIEPVSRKIYWIELGDPAIYRADQDGSNPEVFFRREGDNIGSMVFDVHGRYLYYTDYLVNEVRQI